MLYTTLIWVGVFVYTVIIGVFSYSLGHSNGMRYMKEKAIEVGVAEWHCDGASAKVYLRWKKGGK